ncbi:MAG: DUF1571 domain-containing protein [Planctomycetales bacterium]|nr:DUF1571 domain-containing protein [Planctomycetales bacterium]NIM08748.1 DUF1571 domain-containing protein [Planctomycetales bacterium]NIN08216.1 DUF1571 domain-containing protein [Planctomycetales bacterium]NIN77344.1 DUF1571 domain-containing protein [Planctomycetales bacterium]NIO34527.1 DUF1571 domain-containing protein [Planctomycetales bacterium]
MPAANARCFTLFAATLGLLLSAPVLPAGAQGQAPRHPGGDHPLEPVLAYAHDGLARIDREIQDYTCTLIKRERVDGELLEREYLYAKVRHKPFSVYLYFLAPHAKKGQEVIYVDGRYNNKLCAHAGSGPRALIGKVFLPPEGMLAMTDNRYPITYFGFRTLIKRLIEVGEHDLAYGECEVAQFENAKLNGRPCSVIQVKHPVPREEFRYHLARVFIDAEMQIPVRLTAYEWPEKEGRPPKLVEEYTYVNVKLNQGLTDLDFDYSNEKYRFVSKPKK